jgi:hypothetical protein
MNETQKTRRVYVVVEVLNGVAVDAYSFAQLSAARKCLKQLRKGRNMDEDDVQLFETRLGELPKVQEAEA